MGRLLPGRRPAHEGKHPRFFQLNASTIWYGTARNFSRTFSVRSMVTFSLPSERERPLVQSAGAKGWLLTAP